MALDMNHAITLVGVGLAAGGAAVGAAIGDGLVTGKTIEGIARQPESRSSLMGLMFLSIGLIEAVPIIAIVLAFMIYFKILLP